MVGRHHPSYAAVRTRVFAFLSLLCAMYDSDLIELWIPLLSIVRDVRNGEAARTGSGPGRSVNPQHNITQGGEVANKAGRTHANLSHWAHRHHQEE